MRNHIVLAMGLWMFSGWSGPVAIGDSPERHAVVIGINDYADARIPDLKYAESDAKAVHKTLTDPNVGKFPKKNVKLLLGKAATPSAIKAALYKLRGLSKNDLVVIFYSGHGAKEGEEAFWVTQNADSKALPATALSNTDIRKYRAAIPSQKLVTFLDCCYAASTVKKSLDDPSKLFGDFAGKGRVTIAGSADSQEALEYEDKKAGVFTHFLVAGLRGGADTNDDGAVTFVELWTYLGDHVRKASVKQGGLHEPVIISEQGVTPQFLLTYNPAAKAANDKALTALRKLFAADRITGAQYDEGRTVLTEPAIDAVTTARREVYASLVAGRLDAKYLGGVLKDAITKAQPTPTPSLPTDAKPNLAVVPFEILGNVRVKDAGAILAERLLPHFSERYQLIDQMQLRRFLDQDDLTVAGLAELVSGTPSTKSISKAVRLRAVRTLVVGTISGSPSGRLSVTARLSDWQTGKVDSSRIGQIGADTWDDLIRRLPLLAAKLTGSLGEIGPGPSMASPSLPSGVNTLTARILQLEAIEAELTKAMKTLTAKHPRIAFLRENFQKLGMALAPDVAAKLKELQAADSKLAEMYKKAHPQRTALLEQIAEIEKARTGILARASGSSKKLTLDLGGGVSIKLALIPAGKFMMGSPANEKHRGSDEGPRREVTIGRAFYMAVYEVTQEQYEAVTGKDPAHFKGAKNPVELVSWNDATEFCRRLSAKTGRTVRLPTEAEWEYACRAGTTTPFNTGETISTDQDNYEGLFIYGSGRRGKHRQKTVAVGSFQPNAFGLHDMHGNVWEWCSDWHADSYSNARNIDRRGPSSGTFRVLRGGSWASPPWHCRSANRDSGSPGYRLYLIGFRVVVSLD